MLVGSSTNHVIRITTSAAADIRVAGSKVVVSTATPPVMDGTNTVPFVLAAITTATDTAAVTGAASQIASVEEMSLRNAHASTSCDVTITRTTDNFTTQASTIKCTLLAGESFIYRNGVWLHYDTNGAIYPSVGNVASQADMETATANNKYVSPLAANWHPGAAKCWYRVTVSAGTPTLANSWNITSITDTATGQLTVTIGTDFSGVNYAIATGVERAATALTVANCRNDTVRNATVAAGSFIHECYDQTATTAAAVDPATWYGVCYGDQ
jgi:hypothetical protein